MRRVADYNLDARYVLSATKQEPGIPAMADQALIRAVKIVTSKIAGTPHILSN